jgi:hypothetical protein
MKKWRALPKMVVKETKVFSGEPVLSTGLNMKVVK